MLRKLPHAFFLQNVVGQKLHLPEKLHQINQKPDQAKVLALMEHKQKMKKVMLEKHPHLMTRRFNNQFVYSLRPISPEKILEKGGFGGEYNHSPTVYGGAGNGNNKDCVCFSFLPTVAAIFSNKWSKTKLWIYAIQLENNEDYILTQGNWRQVISPGAEPLSQNWFAREFLGVTAGNQIQLGNLVGNFESNTNDKQTYFAELFKEYSENTLLMPETLSYGDDVPDFDIQGTPFTDLLQKEVEGHYRDNPYQYFDSKTNRFCS